MKSKFMFLKFFPDIVVLAVYVSGHETGNSDRNHSRHSGLVVTGHDRYYHVFKRCQSLTL